MKLPIVKYGDPILRAKGKRIERVDERVRSLVANMLETVHAANGVGLAAQQVGEALQLTIIDVARTEDRPSTMKLNGVDVDPRASMPLHGEPGRRRVKLASADTIEGEAITIEASGLLARALQHEVDHLNGILFIDRMSSATKATLASQLRRLQKETQRM